MTYFFRESVQRAKENQYFSGNNSNFAFNLGVLIAFDQKQIHKTLNESY